MKLAVIKGKSKIEWDEWRQDIRRLDGTLIAKDVLFIRGKLDKVEFYTPVFNESVEDTKQMIEASLKNHAQ